VINSPKLKHEENLDSTSNSEEAAVNRLKEFVNKHNKAIRKFGLLQKPLDSQNFLVKHPDLNPEPEYQKAFNDELSAFRERIRARAKVRLEEAMMQIEEEEKQKRLGPGGLDPVEVFESLPTNLQECFEKKDVELLKTVLCSMDPQQAEYHMKRCVDSGLWVDNARDQQEEDGESSSNVNTDGNDDIAATIQTNKEPIHDNA
ncbi:cell division cycle protein 37, partial [Schistosoma bovis]